MTTGSTSEEAPRPVGRPREHDRDSIKDQLIEWAKKEESINLCGFCGSREPPLNPVMVTTWAREDHEFRLAYETAKGIIGGRREVNLNKGKLHVKAYDLNSTVYDHFLKDEKRIQMELELDIKKQLIEWEAKLKASGNVVDEAVTEQFELLMGQLSALQEARKRAATSKRAESKS